MTDSPVDTATNLIGADNMRKLKQANITVVWEKDAKKSCKTCWWHSLDGSTGCEDQLQCIMDDYADWSPK